jgi:4'-phosphopantetheinyl transferase
MDVSWLEQSEADVPYGNGWLGPNETVRLEGMRFPKRRADWRLGRWTAKRVAAAYLGLPDLKKVEVVPAPTGAPEVFVASQRAPISISLSHRAGLALCVVGPPHGAVGCDLELIEPHSDAFLNDYFTTEEQLLLRRADPAHLPFLATLLWSAKESTLKVLREGLRLDTRAVTVCAAEAASALPAREDQDWHPLQVRPINRQILQGWWRCSGTLLRTLVAEPPPIPRQLTALPVAMSRPLRALP